jgi:hypothetical protein
VSEVGHGRPRYERWDQDGKIETGEMGNEGKKHKIIPIKMRT